jgi:hypothetical protein
MRLAQNYNKNVFCLEGDWQKDLRDNSSVRAALIFLQQNLPIKYIYKQCATRENLDYYLSIWKQRKYSSYSIGYFAFHGQPESIQVGKEFVTLAELGDMLHDSCRDKIIHFGSCKTLNTDRKNIEKFLESTGALCVCGFETEINFIESSAFDMMLIEMFQQYKDMAMLDRNIRKNYRSFVKRLQFKLIYL